MAGPALEVVDVRKSFGGVRAVNGVSLTLERGRIYGLIGPNGSGKTTLFNCITGVARCDTGRILLDGERIERLAPYRIAQRGVGRTFQMIRVFPELTALENLLVVTTGPSTKLPRRGPASSSHSSSSRASPTSTRATSRTASRSSWSSCAC